MLCTFADLLGKDIENDLTNNEKEDSERDVYQWPAILQRIDDENDLHDQVHEQADAVDDIQHDEQPDRIQWTKASPAFEREQRHCGRNDEHPQTRQPQQPHTQRSPVLVELKPHKPIDQQTSTQRARKPILYTRKPRICPCVSGRNDTCIQHQTKYRQGHKYIEKGRYFLAADRGEFRAHVDDHDGCHAESNQVHEIYGGFEDDGVGEGDGAGVTCWEDGGGMSYWV